MANLGKVFVHTRGGKKLKTVLKEMQKPMPVESVRVGFFENAKYPNGLPVAQVAVWNEYGTPKTRHSRPSPARPFFRNALDKVYPRVRKLLSGVDPKKLKVDRKRAEKLGMMVEDAVKRSINDLRQPKNAPWTVARKKSTNPLIDTGQMKLSVTYKVDH